MENWIGAGPSASGTIINDEAGTGLRITRRPDVNAYLRYYGAHTENAFEPLAIEKLDTLTLMKESFLMGFRYSGGPDEILFKKRFGISIGECTAKTIHAWRKRGLMDMDKTVLTREGLVLLNSFLIDCFDELESYTQIKSESLL
jgi:oxygen-independent coproporphyrinogen-3 oxidase